MPPPSPSLTAWQVFRLIRHLPNFATLYWRLFNDRRVPLRAKALLAGAVVYVLSPIDLLPDFLLGFLGILDDLTILIVAARWFISLCPSDVVQEQVRKITEEQKYANRQ